jgi:hypothetical protein
MKITKSELKEMIREAIREELNNRSVTEGAYNGGQAEGGFKDTAKRPGGSTSKLEFNKLDGKKTKIVKAKDLKPGMVTDTGTVQKVISAGWVNGQQSVEVSYGGIGTRGSAASDIVASDKDYEVLDESSDGTLTNDKASTESGIKLKEDGTAYNVNNVFYLTFTNSYYTTDICFVSRDAKTSEAHWKKDVINFLSESEFEAYLSDTTLCRAVVNVDEADIAIFEKVADMEFSFDQRSDWKNASSVLDGYLQDLDVDRVKFIDEEEQ